MLRLPATMTVSYTDTLRAALAYPALHLALVLTAVTAVYVPTLDGYFHGDDFVAMVDIAGKSPLTQLRDVVTFQDSNYYWRPLGEAYYRVIYELGGLDPFWFRLANLAVFLASLILLYLLALRFGLTHVAALGAVLLTGLFANHVVSVAWITNGGRLLAALFFIASLLLLHTAIERRSVALECLAWLSFFAACLGDEVAIALAPIPILYSPMLFWRRESWWRVMTRAEFYGILVAVLLPLQFLFTIDDEWRLTKYHFSADIAEQSWALASQLVLPLTGADPMDVWFRDMPAVQWAAGACAIGLGLLALAFGSGPMRLLLLWTAAALAPFTLWDFDVVSPRYTFLAAFPVSMLVGLLTVAATKKIAEPRLRRAASLSAAGALTAAVVFGVAATMDRNSYFESHADLYERAAQSLKATVPQISPGTRVVVYYGAWRNQDAWLEAMIRTLYRDPTIKAVNIPPERVPAVRWQPEPRDLILFYGDEQFTTRAPLAVR